MNERAVQKKNNKSDERESGTEKNPNRNQMNERAVQAKKQTNNNNNNNKKQKSDERESGYAGEKRSPWRSATPQRQLQREEEHYQSTPEAMDRKG